jgi:hypothetical protein
MAELMPMRGRINCILEELAFQRDVTVGPVVDVCSWFIRVVSNDVDCQCRRCACQIRDPSGNIASTDAKSGCGSCCEDKTDVLEELDGPQQFSRESVVETVDVGFKELDLENIAAISVNSGHQAPTAGG